jgi:hypothetical protein
MIDNWQNKEREMATVMEKIATRTVILSIRENPPADCTDIVRRKPNKIPVKVVRSALSLITES